MNKLLFKYTKKIKVRKTKTIRILRLRKILQNEKEITSTLLYCTFRSVFISNYFVYKLV